MSQDNITESDKAVLKFLADGGTITQLESGITSHDFGDYNPVFLKGCKCGCEGNYTDHTMRLAERGL